MMQAMRRGMLEAVRRQTLLPLLSGEAGGDHEREDVGPQLMARDAGDALNADGKFQRRLTAAGLDVVQIPLAGA